MTRLTARTGRLLGPGTLADLARAAGATPLRLDRPLDLFPADGVRLTFGAAADHIDELAGRLHAAGVRAGDRVTMCRTSSVDLVLLGSAAGRLGAVPAMVSAAQPQDVIGELLRTLDRPWLVTDAATLARLRAVVPVAELVRDPVLVTDAQPPAGTTSLVALAGAPAVEPVTLEEETPALITHTSGTTGVPKLTVQSRRSLGGQVPQQKRMFRLFGFRGSMAMCVSLLHARMVSGFAVMAELRMPTALLVDPGLDNVADVLADFRPGALESHPNIFIRWEELAAHPRQPLASVRLFVNGFDAPHPRTIATLLGASRRRFPLYAQGYGQTEIGLVTGRLYTRARAGHADSRCVGMSYTGFTAVRVAPANGQKPSAAAPGHIEARSRGRALTYLGQDERFRGQVRGDWWRLGDMGYRSRWGCIHLLDREIDRGTGLDSNLAVEDRLMQRLDELVEVVLVPGDGLPLPVVCTRGDRPLDQGAWTRATADLPKLAEPWQCRFEDLPVTSTWKIRRPELTRRITAGELPRLPAAP
jgi:acyl-coenzyme A synthetase/AMP-(fatty) acid ligase